MVSAESLRIKLAGYSHHPVNKKTNTSSRINVLMVHSKLWQNTQLRGKKTKATTKTQFLCCRGISIRIIVILKSCLGGGGDGHGEAIQRDLSTETYLASILRLILKVQYHPRWPKLICTSVITWAGERISTSIILLTLPDQCYQLSLKSKGEIWHGKTVAYIKHSKWSIS